MAGLRRDARAKFPIPVRGWTLKVLPCRRCFNCWCTCEGPFLDADQRRDVATAIAAAEAARPQREQRRWGL